MSCCRRPSDRCAQRPTDRCQRSLTTGRTRQPTSSPPTIQTHCTWFSSANADGLRDYVNTSCSSPPTSHSLCSRTGAVDSSAVADVLQVSSVKDTYCVMTSPTARNAMRSCSPTRVSPARRQLLPTIRIYRTGTSTGMTSASSAVRVRRRLSTSLSRSRTINCSAPRVTSRCSRLDAHAANKSFAPV